MPKAQVKYNTSAWKTQTYSRVITKIYILLLAKKKM